MINIYKDAGERIYMLRLLRGYTRENLAELADISPKFLYEIERGKKGFSAFVLYSLSKALKTDCDYILTGEDKTANYDRKLAETLHLFNQCQAERINEILKEIYKLL